MFHFVYIIENVKNQSWYIGYTTDLNNRVKEHNSGKSPYTQRIPGRWKLIYSELYRHKMDALGREKYLKSGSGRRFLKKQLTHYLKQYDAT